MKPWRSKPFLRAVASMDCGNCGSFGPCQAAHRNEGKGMSTKVSDALVAALCPYCHRNLDQGKYMTRAQRRAFWDRAYLTTVGLMLREMRLVPGGDLHAAQLVLKKVLNGAELSADEQADAIDLLSRSIESGVLALGRRDGG